MENGNTPINPIANEKGFCTSLNNLLDEEATGLTKREYFAGLAMQSLIASINSKVDLETVLEVPSNIAKWSVKFADELLLEIEKN